jgi:hypothetical protein
VCNTAMVDVVFLNKVSSKTCLAEMDCNDLWCDHPLEMRTQEPFHCTHKVDCVTESARTRWNFSSTVASAEKYTKSLP